MIYYISKVEYPAQDMQKAIHPKAFT